MQTHKENSTLVALRELRAYEQDRVQSEKKEEEARKARERKEQERLAEEAANREAEAARERALEQQLRHDLENAEEQLRQLRLEAERRVREAAQAARAFVAPTLTAATTRPGKGSRIAWGSSAVFAVALLVVGLGRFGTSQPIELPRPMSSCPEPVPVAAIPVLPAPTAHPMNPPPPVSVKHPQPPLRPRGPIAPRVPRKPVPRPPTCDGTDPLCGLPIKPSLL